MRRCLSSQQNTFKKTTEIEAATRASFRVAQVLAKADKPFTDGHFIKSCIIQVAEEIYPEKVELRKTISLSANTISRRIEVIGSDIISKLHENASKFQWFSVDMFPIPHNCCCFFVKCIAILKSQKN
jgi:hypothetical protein